MEKKKRHPPCRAFGRCGFFGGFTSISPATCRPYDSSAFLKDTNPDKRDGDRFALPPTPHDGCRTPTYSGRPFLDRWAYFFSHMFRNNEQLSGGIDSFHNYIYKVLE